LSTASKLLTEQYQSVLEEIKPAVSEAVFERLNESIRRNQELLERLQRENKLLRELRRLELLEKYGPSPETLCDEQLELLKLERGVSTTEVEAESQRTQLSLPLKSAPARKHPGRQQLPAELPREEQIFDRMKTAAERRRSKSARPEEGYTRSQSAAVPFRSR
jgi:hypothetical protein